MTFQPKLQNFINENRLSLYTIGAVFGGFLSGLLVKQIFWSDGQPVDPYLLKYLSLPGIIYIRVFLLLIIPLLISSLSTSFLSDETDATKSTNSGDQLNMRKVLLVTFGFFVCFSSISAIIGISIAALGKPGVSATVSVSGVSVVDPTSNSSAISAARKHLEQSNYQTDSIYNIILSIFPDNLVSPLFMNTFTRTEVVWPANESALFESNYVPQLRHKSSYTFKANMMGICAVSLLLGLLLQELGPEKTAGVRQLLRETQCLVNRSMAFLLGLMPAGMFCWMFTESLRMHSFSTVLGQLVHFYALALMAFVILMLVFWPLAYVLFARANIFQLYRDIVPAILVALGSMSSALTLPMTMQCMDRVGLRRPIAQTVLPLGMTLHMNGSALFYPMVAVFVAQVKGTPVDTFSLVILGVFAVVMSMGLPGAPAGAGVIVNHIAFATVIGVDEPQDILAYILAFEWITERIRTAVNIMGDCVVARCVERLMIGSSVQMEHNSFPKDSNASNDIAMV